MECAAEVSGDYPLQVVRYADLAADPKLQVPRRRRIDQPRSQHRHRRQRAGRAASWSASRARCPATGPAGLPTSTPTMLEELYVYFDMPPPAFGIQLVYTRPDAPEFVDDRARRRRGADARRLSPQRRRARPRHQLHLDDGGAPRGRGPPVRRRQRAARLRIKPGSTRARRASRRSRRIGTRRDNGHAMRFVSTGSRALVTGAGTGIGAALARALAEAGADVACHGNRHAPNDTAARHRASSGAAPSCSRAILRERRDRRRAGRGDRRASSGASTSWSTTPASSGARPPSSPPTTTGTRCSTSTSRARLPPVPSRRAGACSRSGRGKIVNIASLLVVPGRHHRAGLCGVQGRRRAADQGARQRMGGRAA